MGSHAFDLATVVGALDQVDASIASPAPWLPANDSQRELLALRAEIAGEMQSLRRLEALASNDADRLNRFLEDRHFATRFAPFASPIEYGAVSTISERTHWEEPGTAVSIASEGREYHGFKLGLSGRCWRLGGENLLVRMPGESSDESVMWLLLGKPRVDVVDQLALFRAARMALGFAADAAPVWYDSVAMPEESLKSTIELGWLVGLSRTEAVLGRALQEVQLRIDRQGSEARVATAIGFAEASPEEPEPELHIVVDAPHLAFWTDAAAPSLPLAVAYFDRDAWSDWDEERAAGEDTIATA
jgi:hypothetical protein